MSKLKNKKLIKKNEFLIHEICISHILPWDKGLTYPM